MGLYFQGFFCYAGCMTTSTTPAPVVSECIITSCPVHGVKATEDFESFVYYVGLVRIWDDSTLALPTDTEPWRCCDQMVIDPHGVLD